MSSAQKELAEGSGNEAALNSARRAKEDKAKEILPNIHISLDKQKSQKRKASKRMTIIKKDKGDKGEDPKETPRTDGEGSDVPDSARSQPADAGGPSAPPAGDTLGDAARSLPAGAAAPGGGPAEKAAAPGGKEGGKVPDDGTAAESGNQGPKDKLPADKDKGASQGARDLPAGAGAVAPKGEAGPKEGPSKPNSPLESAKDKVATVGVAASAAKALADIPAGKAAKDRNGGEAPGDAAGDESGLEGADKGKEAPGPKKSGRGLGKSFSALGRLWGGPGGKDGKDKGKKGDAIPDEDSAKSRAPVAAAPAPAASGPGAGSDLGAGKPGQDVPTKGKDGAPAAAVAAVAAGSLAGGAPSKDKEPLGPGAPLDEPGKSKGRGLEHRPRPLVPTVDPDEGGDEEQPEGKADKGVLGKTLSGLGGLFRSKNRGVAASPVDKPNADGKGSSADRACPSDNKKVELPGECKDQGKNVVDGVPPGEPSKSIPTVMANKGPVSLEVSGSEAAAADSKAKAKKGGIPASVQNAGIAGAFGALGLAFFFFGKREESGEMLEPEAVCDVPWTIKYGDQWMQNWLWHAE